MQNPSTGFRKKNESSADFQREIAELFCASGHLKKNENSKEEIIHVIQKLLEKDKKQQFFFLQIAEILEQNRIKSNILGEMACDSHKLESESILSVSDGFNRIETNHKVFLEYLASMTQELTQPESKKSLPDLLNKTLTYRNRIEATFSGLKELSRHTEKFTDQIRTNLKHVKDQAKQVEDISEQIKIVSINLRIEESKLSNTQTGFHVLGAEITKLADKANGIAEVTTQIINTAQENIEKLETRILHEMETTENSSLESAILLSPVEEALNRTVERMKELLNRTHTISDFINSQTKEVIGNLQFSDITGQELKHRLQLEDVVLSDTEHIMQQLPSLDTSKQQELKERFLLRVAEICTTENERALLYRNHFSPDKHSYNADQIDSDFSKGEVILF